MVVPDGAQPVPAPRIQAGILGPPQVPPPNAPARADGAGGPPDGGLNDGPRRPPLPNLADLNAQPDDQDRPLHFYTPLHDIFHRPALPTLRGPFMLGAISGIMYMAPGKLLYQLAMNRALMNSHATLKGAAYHIMANACKWSALALGDVILKIPSLTLGAVTGWASEHLMMTSQRLLLKAAKLSGPRWLSMGQQAQLLCNAANALSKPIMAVAVVWIGYTLARHAIEPPPYEAPPGIYPNGGPIIEITQEEAANKALVFTCPAPLARQVQERVLLCERDVQLIQKVKSIAARWCDQNNYAGNERYQAVAGAVAAALTVPCIEQNVIQMAQSHAVQQQYGRLANYLSGIKHQNDPWYTKYLLIRR